MGDTLSVSVDTSQDNPQPTLEEEAAKYDSPPADSAEKAPGDSRPEWLPEKFKSAEDLAKAYSELEKKLGSRQAPEATEKAQDGKDQEKGTDLPDAEETARKAAESAGLNFDDMSARYWENGSLDETDYEALEKSGIPKNIVDQFIAGQEALLNTTRQGVFNAVGGEQTYVAMTEWAADNMSESEIDAYNKAVNSGDMNMAMMAVKGLQARFSAAEGFEPTRSVSGANAKPTANVYRSIAELEKDINDPRYKNDTAFRRDVEQKLARSDIM